MLQKLSYTVVGDESGARWVQLFHLYGGSRRRYLTPGLFAKGAVKQVAFYPLRIKGKRYRPIRQGFVVRGLAVHAVAVSRFVDNTRCAFTQNTLMLLKKRGVFKSKYLNGPLIRLVRRRRYLALFTAFI